MNDNNNNNKLVKLEDDYFKYKVVQDLSILTVDDIDTSYTMKFHNNLQGYVLKLNTEFVDDIIYYIQYALILNDDVIRVGFVKIKDYKYHQLPYYHKIFMNNKVSEVINRMEDFNYFINLMKQVPIKHIVNNNMSQNDHSLLKYVGKELGVQHFYNCNIPPVSSKGGLKEVLSCGSIDEIRFSTINFSDDKVVISEAILNQYLISDTLTIVDDIRDFKKINNRFKLQVMNQLFYIKDCYKQDIFKKIVVTISRFIQTNGFSKQSVGDEDSCFKNFQKNYQLFKNKFDSLECINEQHYYKFRKYQLKNDITNIGFIYKLG